jgi:[acyl-carrier-protein] S-malonyltransferase
VVNAALLCPGQGAQRVGMGKDLAAAFPAARDVFAAVDEALGFSLSTVMWEGPEDLLTRTDNAQPAILAHTAAVWALVREKLTGHVAAAAGHSLGEYSAYVAAGSLGLADAARLVRRRGELMRAAGDARPGTMAAVMGLDAERVAAICREASTSAEVVVPANLNSPHQTVISGDPAAVERARTMLKAAGAKRVLPLKVSGAFHSPLMAPPAARFATDLDAVTLAAPAFPVVANATATAVTTADEARRRLAEQLTSPVRWIEGVRRLAEIAGAGVRFVELGPGTALAGLARHILAACEPRNLGTAAEVAEYLEAR